MDRRGYSFFFNDTATTEIYTLSLHDALPIWYRGHRAGVTMIANDEQLNVALERIAHFQAQLAHLRDRKSTRLNSSHANISYAVFCLKKKNHSHPRIILFTYNSNPAVMYQPLT